MEKLILFAETQQKAIDYARKNKLNPSNISVLSRPDGMKFYPKPLNVLLIGKVEKREDYEELLQVLEEVEAIVNRVAG